MEKQYIVIKEGFIRSIITDAFSFGILMASVAINSLYLWNSGVLNFFFCVMFLIALLWMFWNVSKKFTDKEEAIKFIKED